MTRRDDAATTLGAAAAAQEGESRWSAWWRRRLRPSQPLVPSQLREVAANVQPQWHPLVAVPLAGAVPGAETAPEAAVDKGGAETGGAHASDAQLWMLTCHEGLLVVSGAGTEAGAVIMRPWMDVERLGWDAQERCFTVTWCDGGVSELVVPAWAAGAAVDSRVVARCARVIRERVDASVVHRIDASLPSGRELTLTVRRTPAGELCGRVTPAGVRADDMDSDDRRSYEGLVRQICDDVSMTTLPGFDL